MCLGKDWLILLDFYKKTKPKAKNNEITLKDEGIMLINESESRTLFTMHCKHAHNWQLLDLNVSRMILCKTYQLKKKDNCS